jgi:hypothetical protein
MADGEKIISAAESALHRMPKKRNSESCQSRGSRHSTQGKCWLILGSIKLAKFMRLMPFAEDGRERWPVGIGLSSWRRLSISTYVNWESDRLIPHRDISPDASFAELLLTMRNVGAENAANTAKSAGLQNGTMKRINKDQPLRSEH